MQRLQVKLLGGLGGDALHRRPLDRLGGRLRIAEIILLSLRLRWCAPTQASMPIKQGGMLANRISTWLRDHLCRSTTAPR